MKSMKLDILLEHLDLKCNYFLEDPGGGDFCERAWENTDRETLMLTRCLGLILNCNLTNFDVIRDPKKEKQK